MRAWRSHRRYLQVNPTNIWMEERLHLSSIYSYSEHLFIFIIWLNVHPSLFKLCTSFIFTLFSSIFYETFNAHFYLSLFLFLSHSYTFLFSLTHTFSSNFHSFPLFFSVSISDQFLSHRTQYHAVGTWRVSGRRTYTVQYWHVIGMKVRNRVTLMFI